MNTSEKIQIIAYTMLKVINERIQILFMIVDGVRER